MANNRGLHAAKRAKNDEFYTRLTDIEHELGNYHDHFKGKHIFLNADDPVKSEFWQHFAMSFDQYGLKQLTSTHYEEDKSSYRLDIIKDINGDGRIDGRDVVSTPLKQNGDFRSDEAIEILEECDIVVTNPPFSLFREYIAQLMEYDKKFIIIGNKNAITYKEVFPLIKEGKVWLGLTSPKEFILPDGGITKKVVGLTRWFTNLPHNRRKEDIILYREFNEEDYPKYDNYDAIEVNRVANIPKDYYGVMGVPITFLDKYNPDQFEIVGYMASTTVGEFNKGYPFVDGVRKYARILIKRKDAK